MDGARASMEAKDCSSPMNFEQDEEYFYEITRREYEELQSLRKWKSSQNGLLIFVVVGYMICLAVLLIR
jgi:hypothetical protein